MKYSRFWSTKPTRANWSESALICPTRCNRQSATYWSKTCWLSHGRAWIWRAFDPGITSHKLNVDPTIKPIRQKQQKLGPERSKAVNEGGWTTALSQYSSRQKEERKMAHLRWFYRLKQSLSEGKLPAHAHWPTRWVDCWKRTLDLHGCILRIQSDHDASWYLRENDVHHQEGDLLLQGHAIQPKNAGATYQRLVNWMFADKLGNTMEVWSSHFTRLKLNPAPD